MKEYLSLVAKERQFNQVYACGPKYYDEMVKALDENGAIRADNIIVKDYIYNMAEVMGQSDLVVCRAGGTLNELCSAGMPSVLVPSPFAAENHQESNARVLERAGAAIVLLEPEISSESLYNTVKSMVQSKERLVEMGAAAEKLAHNDSLSHIYSTIKEIIG
jgi:UDP-N-acetylglucosamine--N-acetylmuramyl-(pentapeptide) pyrophosphoryl-undecaprenol N-acetylglucosamine transferase